jgi:two-component system, response regulator PdtaR
LILWVGIGIPIIIVTENGDFESVQRWGELMVYAILAKPVRVEELIAALVLSIATTRRVDQLNA